jgi:DNA-binding transcriptional LysR family regulator
MSSPTLPEFHQRRVGSAFSKSIVSRRLLRLETELGVQLLARTTRGAVLTEAGVSFREHAARISAEMEAAREDLAPSGSLRGRMRIAAPPSFGPILVAPVLAELARRHPRSRCTRPTAIGSSTFPARGLTRPSFHLAPAAEGRYVT